VDQEVALPGGDVTEGVVRVGDTVRRPLRAHTPAVHDLLRHLEKAGFDGAPRALGIDEQGREVLSWVPGQTPNCPLPPHAATGEALAGVARLLRRFHDAVHDYEPPRNARWDSAYTSNVDDPPEIVGHCDVTPDNVVFRGDEPTALIDFDLARPTTRLFDVVTTLRHWVPLADPADRDASVARADIPARLRLFTDAYGLTADDRRALLPVARLRFERSYEAMRARAERHGGGWARIWRTGAGPQIRRAQDWLDLHWDELDAALR
jgi:phosphotransferase family enzyme